MPNPSDHRLYTPRFFQVFLAVMLLMTGTSLQYHFGQYVSYRGYGVDVLGLILGVSMVGALAIRLQVGRWIDRYGVKPVWLAGTLLAATAAATMQFVAGAYGIVALRMLAVMALSSAMTAGTVFAAQIAPPERRAESIGSIGLAGFLGMIVGPALGDLIFHDATDSITPYREFFTLSAACFAMSGVVASTVSVRDLVVPVASGVAPVARRRARSNQLRVIREYWPGMVLLVGVSFSMVFTIQSLFLERFAEYRGFNDIKTFFLVYCPTAIVLRLIFRRVPERFGRRPTILLGAGFMVAGLLALTRVTTEVGLIVPALLMGAGHCFIFPSMIDLSAGRFPAEHRGTGTALILGAGDLGMLIGFATVGEVIDRFGYTSAIVGLATVLAVVAAALAVSRGSESTVRLAA